MGFLARGGLSLGNDVAEDEYLEERSSERGLGVANSLHLAPGFLLHHAQSTGEGGLLTYADAKLRGVRWTGEDKMAEWRYVHIGVEGDAAHVGGVQIWNSKWRPLGGKSVTLPHPSYLAEMHPFYVYEIDKGEEQIRFAACELSPGVWGFYEPT